jgi:predicted metal-binding protein
MYTLIQAHRPEAAALDIQQTERILNDQEYGDFKWITGRGVVTARFVKFKCMYGCPDYGRRGACPPHVPPLEECRELFLEYEHIAVLRFQARAADIESWEDWSAQTNRGLLQLERALFMAGHHKAFALFMDKCLLCEDCPGTRLDCKDKANARPSPEALGVDVFATVRNAGYEIGVLGGRHELVSRFAMVLVE